MSDSLPTLALIGQMGLLRRPNDRPIDYARDVTVWRLDGEVRPPRREEDYRGAITA